MADLLNCCRLCMTEEYARYDIFQSEICKYSKLPLEKIIEDITTVQIQQNGNISQKICCKCHYLLVKFFDFRQRCIKMDQKLTELLMQNQNENATDRRQIKRTGKKISNRKKSMKKKKESKPFYYEELVNKSKTELSDETDNLVGLFSDDSSSISSEMQYELSKSSRTFSYEKSRKSSVFKKNIKPSLTITESTPDNMHPSIKRILEQYPSIILPSEVFSSNFECQVEVASFQQLMREAFCYSLKINNSKKQDNSTDITLEQSDADQSNTSTNNLVATCNSMSTNDSTIALQHNNLDLPNTIAIENTAIHTISSGSHSNITSNNSDKCSGNSRCSKSNLGVNESAVSDGDTYSDIVSDTSTFSGSTNCPYCKRKFPIDDSSIIEYHLDTCHTNISGEAKILIEQLKIPSSLKGKRLSTIALCDNEARICLQYSRIKKYVSIPRTLNAATDFNQMNIANNSLTFNTLSLRDSSELLKKVVSESITKYVISLVGSEKTNQNSTPEKENEVNMSVRFNPEEHRQKMLKKAVLSDSEHLNSSHANVPNVPASGLCQEYLPSNNKKSLADTSIVPSNTPASNSSPAPVPQDSTVSNLNVGFKPNFYVETNKENTAVGTQINKRKASEEMTEAVKRQKLDNRPELATKTASTKSNQFSEVSEGGYIPKARLEKLISSELSKCQRDDFIASIINSSLTSLLRNKPKNITLIEQLVHERDIPVVYDIVPRSTLSHKIIRESKPKESTPNISVLDWDKALTIDTAYKRDKLTAIVYDGTVKNGPAFNIPLFDWRLEIPTKKTRPKKYVATKSTSNAKRSGLSSFVGVDTRNKVTDKLRPNILSKSSVNSHSNTNNVPKVDNVKVNNSQSHKDKTQESTSASNKCNIPATNSASIVAPSDPNTNNLLINRLSIGSLKNQLSKLLSASEISNQNSTNCENVATVSNNEPIENFIIEILDDEIPTTCQGSSPNQIVSIDSTTNQNTNATQINFVHASVIKQISSKNINIHSPISKSDQLVNKVNTSEIKEQPNTDNSTPIESLRITSVVSLNEDYNKSSKNVALNTTESRPNELTPQVANAQIAPVIILNQNCFTPNDTVQNAQVLCPPIGNIDLVRISAPNISINSQRENISTGIILEERPLDSSINIKPSSCDTTAANAPKLHILSPARINSLYKKLP